MIVYATGVFFLLDTATGHLEEGCYFDGDERSRGRSLGAAMADDRLVLLRDRTLGFI